MKDMELYDSFIRETTDLLGAPTQKWAYKERDAWKDNGESELVLLRDAAYELGGGANDAVNFTCVTSDSSLVPADEVLRQVGLGERMQNFPAQLSGGEQQRVAIARALAKRPRLLLCDEPTGALDYQTGKQILALLQKQSRENGMTVVIITHNSALTAMADRVIRVRSGQITDVRQNAAPVPVESIEW